MSLKPGVRLAVFSIKKDKFGNSTWTRAGSAYVNRDESINVRLDVLPLDGNLHCREQVVEKREAVQLNGGSVGPHADLATAEVGGNS